MSQDLTALLSIIEDLKKENDLLKSQPKKEFGLNFEKSVITNINDYQLNKTIELDNNYLIEGDNAYVLNSLLKTHKGKVNVIYIDPPYNTRKSDFKYKDSMLREQWLSFMYNRLILAKELLSVTGSIFISITDQEYAYLRLICDEIFGEDNFIGNFIWKKSHTVKNDKKGISSQHEYILCFAKDKKSVFLNKEQVGDSYINKMYRFRDEKGIYRTVPLHKKKNKNTFPVFSPNGTEWNLNWNHTQESFNKLVEEDMIYWGKDGSACPNKKVYLKDVMDKTYGTMLNPDKVKYTGSGGKDLEELGIDKTDFLYAKPVDLVAHFLEIASDKNSIILDFFAGSGTTAQSVMKLNDFDNGNRKFILVTNNENNICKEITYPRILKAAEKYSVKEPIEYVELLKIEEFVKHE